MWKAGRSLDAAGVRFLPAINEELGATAVLGTQRVESDPERTVDGVFALWYGKGPGVDRAGDALKHGNAYGASPHGGVLMVAGDDHGCVSSSMPHQSDQAFQSWHMPIVAPANVAEYLEFGLYGWALSRFSGNWVGFTALSEVVESGIDGRPRRDRTRASPPGRTPTTVRAATGYRAARRRPALPLARPAVAEDRAAPARQARRGARASRASTASTATSCAAPHATVGIVTCGKAHYDLHGGVAPPRHLARRRWPPHGVRIYKVGLAFPLEPTRMRAFARGLEGDARHRGEGAGRSRSSCATMFYNARRCGRAIVGKRDAQRRAAGVSARRAAAVAPDRDRRATGSPATSPQLDRRHLVRDFTLPELLSNASDCGQARCPTSAPAARTTPSTKVPEGSRAQAGIGCHFMAIWMDRDTEGLIQMGGEGVDWVSHAMFTKVPHVFQNLGDGTYYHSGYLAIRQAIAAKANDHLQDPLQRRGRDDRRPAGRRHHHASTAIARQVEAEGAKKVVVLSRRHRASTTASSDRFPAGTEFHDRDELDAVQRRLREMPGVTVLIYEQTCAAEKRRRRKKGELVDPARRLFINERVCEGCGDCSRADRTASPCCRSRPSSAASARSTSRSCNKDYSCAKGFCPSFVGVRRRQAAQAAGRARRAGGGPFARAASTRCRCRRRTPGPARTTCSSPASAAPASSRSAR